jgi:hypothetical protein
VFGTTSTAQSPPAAGQTTAAAGQTTAAAGQTTAAAGQTTTVSFSTSFSTGASPEQRRLLNCIVRAQGDVNKIVRCQQRYSP